MLTLVQVVCECVGGLQHAVTKVSEYLVEWYAISLIDAVTKSPWMLNHLLGDNSFGTHHDDTTVHDAMARAATTNNLSALRLLWTYGFSRQSLRTRRNAAFGAAAANGHSAILGWFRENHPSVGHEKAMVMASEHGQLATVRYLCEWDLDQQAQSAARHAARNGHLPVVEFLYATDRIACLECVLEQAVVHGQMAIATWLEDIMATCTSKKDSKCGQRHLLADATLVRSAGSESTKNIMKTLVVQGKISALRWLWDRFPKLTMCQEFLVFASESGDLQVVQWLFAKWGKRWNKKSLQKSANAACQKGHLKIIEFFLDHGVCATTTFVQELVRTTPWNVIESMITHCKSNASDKANPLASTFNQMAILMEKHWDSFEFVYHAVEVGDLSTVQRFFRNIQFEVVDLLRRAISYGQMEVVKYLFDKKNRMKGPGRVNLSMRMWMDSLSEAADHGHHEVLKFMLTHEKPGVNSFNLILFSMIRHRFLSGVRLLHTNGAKGFCPDTMDQAARAGSLSIVRFLHENRSEGCTERAMDEAAAGGYLHIVKYLHANRTEGCTTNAMRYAASGGHLRVVQFLHEHRSEGCSEDAVSEATEDGHLPVVQFLLTHRSDAGTAEEALEKAVICGHVDIVEWLVDNGLCCRDEERARVSKRHRLA